MKNVKYCPICAAKKVIHAFEANPASEENYNNGAALTPPMGWSSWNLFRHKISEELIKQIADAMDKSGLKDAGYNYVNIDDCWQSSSRDENGKLLADVISFPSGIKKLSEYVNSLGLKLGIYSSNGTLTCEDYPASLYNEKTDADTFAEWGVEYFKYDFCHNEPIPTKAPLIVKMSVGIKSEDELVSFTANDAVLSGNARIVKDEKLTDKYYIKGLCSHNGVAEFKDITVPKDGEYVLTFTIKKEGKSDKFLVISVNDEREYQLRAPGTKSHTPEGRLQISVYLKEGKNSIKLFNPIGSRADSAAYQYTYMGNQLKRATKEYAEKNGIEEKPIVYSICEWGLNRPWKWGRQAGNLWRTTPDIRPKWYSIMGIYELTMKLSKYSGIGGWNDPDMLEVGNGDLTYEENKSHFSLWCMMSAPLILGNDIRNFIKDDGSVDTENKVYQILTNKNLISVDQDKLGIPCKKINTSLTTDILVKPLDGNRAAVCVFNKDNKPMKIAVPIKDIANAAGVNLASKDMYEVLDCWTERTIKSNMIIAEPDKHGVEVFIVK